MIKNGNDKIMLSSDIASKENLKTDKIKTTDINILLNRVRLDKKKALKKRIIFSFTVISLVVSLAVCFYLI